MSLFTPQRFGRYLLIEKIATGGMAEVFKAKSYGVEGFEKLLVIKRILPHLSCNPRFVSMFITEAKIAVSLSHVNIGQVFHLGREGDDYFISMEYIHGRDLMHVIRECRRQQKQVPLPLAIFIAAEVARGLDYAHRTPDAAGNPLRIIHRDISSHNIILSFEGEVKIVDFGIAQLADQLTNEDQQHQMAGKATYMSPEQALAQQVDTRSDLFSLGSVLYELVTGQRLYQGQSLNEKLDQARAARFNSPRMYRPDLPEGLEAVLLRMLSREASQRHPTASDLYEDLTQILFESHARVTAQDVRAFMQDLFAEEIRQDATHRKLQEAVESLDRLGRYAEDLTRSFGSHESFSSGEANPSAHLVAPRLPEPAPAPAEVTAPGPGPGVRRLAVVMIVEPFGLTDLSLALDPESYLQVAVRWLKEVARVVESRGGRVDRFLNERVWALWGLTTTSEHDVANALLCADELRAVQRRFNERQGLDLGIAIALHRGPILVGEASHGVDPLAHPVGRVGYTPLGDTLRLPERMLVDAKPGAALVSDAVRQPVEADFRFLARENLVVPWGTGSAALFDYTGEKTPRERHPPAAPPQRDRWHDRGDEREVLRRLLRELKEGRGGVVYVSGEAGIGKSRFLQEFGRYAHHAELGLVTGSCLFRDRERPLALFRDMLTAGCRIEPEDSQERRQEKVQRLAELGLSPMDLEFIASVLGVAHHPVEDARERLRGVFRAIRKVMEGLTRDRPVVLAIENIQWMDQRSRDLMGDLLASLAGRPLLVVMSHRLDFQPPWEGVWSTTSIALGPLPAEGVGALVRSLLEVSELPEGLLEVLLHRSDGNPLHVEHLVKVLQEQGRLTVVDGKLARVPLPRDFSVPLSLQGLIESRIEALSDADRALLQIAAVCGRRADLRLIQRVGESDGEVVEMDRFDGLISKGLVAVDREEGQLAFQTHLTWEVIYQGIPPRLRRDMHRRVAVTLREMYAGAEHVHAEELYHHYLEGGRRQLAARYAEAAADRYRSEFFVFKSIDFYTRAIELLGDQDDEAGAEASVILRDLARLYTKLGRLQAMVGDARAAEASLLKGLDIASELEDEPVEASLLITLGKLKVDHGEAFVARNYLEMALENAEVHGASALLAQVLESLGTFHLRQGDTTTARQMLDRGLAVAQTSGEPYLIGSLLIRLGDLEGREGAYTAAHDHYDRCIRMAQEASDRLLLGRALNNKGSTFATTGDYEEALECFRRSIDVRKGIGYVRGTISNYHNIGELFFRKGALGKAYAYFEESLNLAREYQWPVGEASNLVYMGYIEAVQGEPAGLERLHEGLEIARRGHHEDAVANGLYLEGRYLASQKDPSAAQVLKDALQMTRSHGDRALEEAIEEELHQAELNATLGP